MTDSNYDSIDRRDHKLEKYFISLLTEHAESEEATIEELRERLDSVQNSVDSLTRETREILNAYDTTQKAIKVSIGLGKFIKFILGIMVAYYAFMNYINPHN
jgi:hypothetical protein